jgi:Rps23 Pro-64 3,4-dihydroxylase Tpa1-like proline 4-hydroxylase
MSLIYIEDDFLSKENCINIIKYYQNNSSEFAERYGKTYPINITDKYLEFKEIINKVIRLCFFISKEKIQLQRSEIVKWPPGSYMKSHYDPPSDVLSCIVYLNDDYDGGSTCFSETFKVQPKVGRTLVFSNSEYIHSVEKVDNNSRYTMAFWFTKIQ